MIDGTHTRVLRPPDSAERKAKYSGKKKFTSYNTNVMTTLHGLIVFQSRSVDGSKHDFTLFKDDMPDFTPWEKLTQTGATRDKSLVTLLGDKGFQGMEKHVKGITVMLPHKRRRGGAGLTGEELDRNKIVNSIRVRVEHAIRRVKQHARIANLYTGTKEEFGYDFGIAAGLANFHLMWQDIRDGNYEFGQPLETKPAIQM